MQFSISLFSPAVIRIVEYFQFKFDVQLMLYNEKLMKEVFNQTRDTPFAKSPLAIAQGTEVDLLRYSPLCVSV